MRSLLLKLFAAFVLFICIPHSLTAQNCFNTGLNGTVINLPCNQNCVNVPLQIPHLKSSSNYRIVSTAYAPFTFVTPGGNEPTEVYMDDKFSHLYNLPFSVCFYDSAYNTFVVGSNAVISFDAAQADCNNDWQLDITPGVPQPIPHVGTGTCLTTAARKYPPRSIMGVYQDINPNATSTTPNRKIEWRVEGTAPCRKLIVSFYQIALFGNINAICTSQIVVYESTGLIDVFVKDKPLDTDGSVWNSNFAILGIQKDDTTALAAPGRNCTVWAEQNAGYRFVPSGGTSRFVSCTVQTLSGTFIATGDTITTTPGLLDVTFPTFCPLGTGGQYIVKTIFSACDNAANQIISYDTITINKTSALNAAATTTQTACGVNGTGTATVVVPSGLGSAPYTYVLTPGNITHTGNDTSIFTNLTAGTYNVHVTDAGGCFSDVPVTITSTGLLTVNFTSVNASCPGAYNGSVTANVPNGTPPVQYSINGGPLTSSGTSYTFTGLSAASPPVGSTYYFIIQDAGGCNYIGGYTIYAGTSTVTGTAAATNTTCAGANNGSIQVTPSGTGPFQYSLNGGPYQTSSLFTGLAPGTYNITIQEGGACTSGPITATVASGSGLVAGITPSNTTCTGVSNGTITVTPTTGTAPFTAVLDGITTYTGNAPILFNGVGAGPHSVTLTDANGCVATSPLTTTVVAGSGFNATYTPTPTGCAGGHDGKLAISSLAPGTAPFTIVLNPGAITQSGNNLITFNNLAAGAYTALITDANGCQFTLNNMTVAAGAGLIATPTPIQTTCAGVNNGSISITSNGTAPFTFVLDGTITQTSATNTATFINLSAGPHSITVTDANGCITAAPVTSTVPAGTGFTSSFNPTPTGCVGVNNGSLAITSVAPGTAPFTIVLNPGAITQTGSNLITFNNLAAGTYTAVVTDANGCQFPLNNMTVPAGSGLTASPTATFATSCSGVNNGKISVTMNNGAAPFTFVLDGVITQISVTNTTLFINVTAGPHSITVTDVNGCITSAPLTATVAVGTGFTASPSTSAVLCAGGSTGSITVTPTTAGTAPFTFVLNGTATQTAPVFTTFNGLPAGTANNVVITDAVGCTFTLNNIVVTEPAPLIASAPLQPVKCKGGNDGVITVIASGGTAPYSYSLNNVTYQPGNIFNVIAGPYTVYVKDANGCSIAPIVNITITEPALLTATAVTTKATCDGGSDGTITITPVGGTTAYQYSLNGATYQAANNFNVGPGSFDVTVKDANGCTFPVNTIIVGLTNNLTYTHMTDPPAICEGSSTALQLVTNATQFAWTNGGSLSNGTIANPVANPVDTTLYKVTATLGRCFIIDSVLVAVMKAPIPDAGLPSDTICYGHSYQLQGSGGVIYSWTPPTYLSSASIYNPQVVLPEKTTTYTLSVTDANGCSSLVTDQIIVSVTPPIKVSTYPFDTVAYAGAQIPLLATSVGTHYIWTSSTGTTGLDNPNIANPVATAPLLDGSIVIYEVTASTAADCRGKGYVRVQVYKGPDIYVVTAFSPNGDGKNETFIPFPVGIKKLNYFRVFNRWGQMLFSTTTLNKGWDGKFGGAEQASGVYVWMVEGVTMDNKLITKKGTVTVIR